MSDPTRYLPYPELLEPRRGKRPFSVDDSRNRDLPSTGLVNLVDRWMYVPLDERGEPVRRHELAHVRWSPQRLPKVAFDHRILAAVEDARINLGLERAGAPLRLSPGARGHVAYLIEADLDRNDVPVLVMRTIASIGCDLTTLLFETIETHDEPLAVLVRDWVERVEAALEAARRKSKAGCVAPFEHGVAIAEQIAHEIEVLGFRSPPGAPASFSILDAMPAGKGSGKSDPAGKGDGRARDPASQSGVMTIATAPLRLPIRPAAMASRGARASDEGTTPRYWNRWVVDKAVFRRKLTQQGGTVLVDTSGSMRLSASDLDSLLGAFGGALVAIYSGRDRMGELRIVARDGRRAGATDLKPFANGNVVDLPALEWLGKQNGPRVWVSDGVVTGIGDRRDSNVDAACKRILQAKQITRVNSMAEACKALTPARREDL